MLCAQGRTRYDPQRPHTSIAVLCWTASLLLGPLLCPLLDGDNLNRLGSHQGGLAAPDEATHGPDLSFWTLGAWQVRGRGGPGSVLHLRKVHCTFLWPTPRVEQGLGQISSPDHILSDLISSNRISSIPSHLSLSSLSNAPSSGASETLARCAPPPAMHPGSRT